MRILLSGSSGFVGSALLSYLSSQAHEVVRLRRGVSWDIEKGTFAKDDFEGFDAVIHLAGESIMGRWSARRKQQILASRAGSTALLAKILTQVDSPPKVFISASAVGFYGDRGEELLNEESGAGRGFLPDVCVAWEKGARAVEKRGVRVVHTRFGMVLGRGGALQKMRPLFKWGLGGVLGSGSQWVSWIALEDLVRAMEFVLHCESIRGAVNFVSPQPVREREFVRELGASLHRPTFLAQPAWLLRLLFGEMAEALLLSSARVEPAKLLRTGFQFRCPSLQKALDALSFGV